MPIGSSSASATCWYESSGDKFFVSQWFVDDVPVRGRPEVHRAFVTWFTEANLKLHTRQRLVDIDIYRNKTFSSLTASPDRCPATSRHRCGESLIQLLAGPLPLRD